MSTTLGNMFQNATDKHKTVVQRWVELNKEEGLLKGTAHETAIELSEILAASDHVTNKIFGGLNNERADLSEEQISRRLELTEEKGFAGLAEAFKLEKQENKELGDKQLTELGDRAAYAATVVLGEKNVHAGKVLLGLEDIPEDSQYLTSDDKTESRNSYYHVPDDKSEISYLDGSSVESVSRKEISSDKRGHYARLRGEFLDFSEDLTAEKNTFMELGE